MNFNKHFSSNNWCPFFLVGLLALTIFYSPYIILGKDSVWYANDYLELVVPIYKILVDQGAILKSNDFFVNNLLDQLPRGVFPSELFLITWFYYFFEPFQAILYNKLLIQFIAFCSAFHFLWFWKKSWGGSIIALLSLLWATLPFWPEGGIGTAFFPTIFYVFYQLYQGEKIGIKYFSLILFYVIYSQLYLHGLFVGIAVFIIGIKYWREKKSFNINYWKGLALLILLYTAASYRLFYIYFFARNWFIPHRAEYEIHSFSHFHNELWGVIWQHLSKGVLHGTFFSPFPILLSLLAIIWVGYQKALNKESLDSNWRRILKLTTSCVVLAFFASVIRFTPILDKVEWMKSLNQFCYDRFSLFIAPLLMLVLAFVLQKVYKWKKWVFGVIYLLVLSWHFLVLDDNHRNIFLKPILGSGEHYASYREFYAQQQFKEMKEFLQEQESSSVKVGSLGIHPGVATFNGLKSIDGYTGNYPLSYKHQFFEVIKNEVKPGGKKGLYAHFMGWGNKCYLFNQHQGDHFLRFKWFDRVELKDVDYNYDKLLEMGCKYLISTDPFKGEERVELLKLFKHKESAWDLYLYEIKSSSEI